MLTILIALPITSCYQLRAIKTTTAILKEVADICEIPIELSTHIARHTFATTICLDNDVPIETVSRMLGHKNIRTTQIYARVSKKKISNNMDELERKLFSADGQLQLYSKDNEDCTRQAI